MAAANTGGAEAADAQRKERVEARWSILRQALLGASSGASGDGAPNTTAPNDGRFHAQSMNAFPGFQILDRTVLAGKDGGSSPGSDACAPDSEWDLVRYYYASPDGRAVQFAARETKVQPTAQQSSVKRRAEALLSHRKYGVDNTGNVRVWDAEGTLAGFLLSVLDGADDAVLSRTGSEQSAKMTQLRKALFSRLTNSSMEGEGGDKSCNLLELGAGQAGLAGLALTAAGHTENSTPMKPLRVVLTDGHPSCVENNVACAELLPKSEDPEIARVDAHLLLWDSGLKGAEACHQINEIVRDGQCHTGESADAGSYQICIASDCVHFQEFHDGLLTTIARTLAVGGIALLCQPSRGDSLGNFMALVDAVNGAQTAGDDGASRPLFKMALFEDFHPKVSSMHTSLIAGQSQDVTETNGTPQSTSQYKPNWHRPLLLALQKLRPYDEGIDGEVARQHVKTRKQ